MISSLRQKIAGFLELEAGWIGGRATRRVGATWWMPQADHACPSYRYVGNREDRLKRLALLEGLYAFPQHR